MALDLGDVWRWFGEAQCGAYSPLYARICAHVADDTELLDFISTAPAHAHQPNVLLAAVHFLLLGGLDHPLGAVYEGRSDDDPGPLFADVALHNRDAVMTLMTSRHTNTNEVGRSALLGPAITTVAQRYGSPFALVDVGCSAGLNLLCDSYRLDYLSFGATGPVDAPVVVECTVVGGHPPIAPQLPAIASRVGIDRDPVDLSNDDNARWQLACVWPDTGRLPRTRAAIDAWRANPPTLVEGDAVDEVARVIAQIPRDIVTVVTTTWALAYLPPDRRIAFGDALAEASRGRIVAWVSGEADGIVPGLPREPFSTHAEDVEPSILGLVTCHDGDATAELLAQCHPHGRWLDWRD